MITQSITYSFKKPLGKVHYCLPTINDSLVVVHSVCNGKDGITHFDSKSRPVFTHSFNDLVDTLGMVTRREAIVLLVRANQIFVLDLETHQKRILNHSFTIDVSCQVNLFTFCEASLICLCENGTYNNNLLRLTYYKHPLKSDHNKELQPYAEFFANQGEWTYQFMTRKGNAHSMVLWFRSRHYQQIEIRCYDLRDNPKGLYRILLIKNSVGLDYGVQRINFSLQSAWEMQSGVLLLVAFTDKIEKNCRNTRGNVIDNYVWDIEKECIREAKVEFDPKYNSFQIHCQSSGLYSMFRTFYLDQGKGSHFSPALYINNANEEVEASQQWTFSHLSNWTCPGYSNSLFVEAEYEDRLVSDIKIKSKMFVPRRILSYHLLSQAYPALDSSLLNDAVSLLQY